MHTLLLALALAAAARTAAACDLYISEFVEGSTLDAIELFNPSSVDVRLGDYGFLVCHGGCGPMAMVDQYEMRLQGTDTDVVPAGGTWTYCMVAEKNDDEEVPTACDVTGEWDSDAESGNDGELHWPSRRLSYRCRPRLRHPVPTALNPLLPSPQCSRCSATPTATTASSRCSTRGARTT